MNHSKVTKGFVTVATGAEEYYKLAASLALSYQRWGKGNYPFAIICNEENEYTRYFDDVVHVKHYRKDTIDKLLMRYSPYQESIFLDADILIMDSIDDLWDVFAGSDDVGIFGCTYPMNSKRGWFTYEGCGEYKDRLHFMIDMNGGIVFFRQTNRAATIFNTALNFVDEYQNFNFKRFPEPADEPIMALSLSVNNCKPVDFSYNQIIIPGMSERVTTDSAGNIYVGKKNVHPKLIHFSNIRTKHFLYNYLNDLLLHGDSHKNEDNYRKIRREYRKIDGRFNFHHNVGAVMREMGLGKLVETIKKVVK